MCGLVGIAGALQYPDEFTMKRLLLSDYFRGPDSTGMAAIRTNGDIFVSKIASNPINLYDMGHFKAALNGSASRAFIGHNRLKTRGMISDVNAHPFHVDHIVGAHNGTLKYSSVKSIETELGEKFDVDSIALFNGIAKLGVEKTIKMCEEGATYQEGAWALTWFDKNEGTLNFLRNKHRPLFYSFLRVGEDPKIRRLIWASEWWMIREAIEASENGKYKIDTKKVDKGNIGYFSFDADVHFKFDLAELTAGSDKRPKPKAKKLSGKEPEPVKSYVPFAYQEKQGEFENWPRPTTCGIPTTSATNQKSTTLTTTRSKYKPNKKVIELLGEPNKNPYANIIDEDKFNSFADSNGKILCTWCQNGIHFGDPGVTIFEREGQILCRKCSGYPDDHFNPPVRIHIRPSVFDKLC